MLRGLFGGKKQGSPKADSFGTVSRPSPRTAVEYRGTIPATKGVTHYLFCSELRDGDGAILLDQGFKPVAGTYPTHNAKCVFSLGKDAGKVRTLFDLYFDLQEIASPGWRNWIFIETCRSLKKRLLTCKERSLLIRCRSSQEYEWCLDDETIDFNWLDDGNRYLRASIKEYESMRQV